MMQFIITKLGKKLPVHNVIKHINPLALEIQIRESTLDIPVQQLKEIFENQNETKELETRTDENIWINTYSQYQKPDDINIKYDIIIQEAIPEVAAQEAVLDENGEVLLPAVVARPFVPEIKDNIVTIILIKLSTIEFEIASTRQDVDNLTMAMAELLGV